jgi:hypothetical protein
VTNPLTIDPRHRQDEKTHFASGTGSDLEKIPTFRVELGELAI